VLRELKKALKFDSEDVNGVIEDLDSLLSDFTRRMAIAQPTDLEAGERDVPDGPLERVEYGRFLDPDARKAFYVAGMVVAVTAAAHTADNAPGHEDRLARVRATLVGVMQQTDRGASPLQRLEGQMPIVHATERPLR
jgi:hypothetical protein